MTENNSKLSAYGNGAAREAIISSIRRSLAASAPFDAAHREHHVHERTQETVEDGVRSELSRDVLLDNFKQNLESVGGHCSVVTSERDASNEVRKIIESTEARRIAISDSELVRRIVDSNGVVEVIENASTEVLFDCDLGITGAQWAIAETGTLVLESDTERHRLTSLVPGIHLCILKADRIRQTLGEVLGLTTRKLSRTITFITGASRTSDIELTLAIGVHGPAELYVIVIADQQS